MIGLEVPLGIMLALSTTADVVTTRQALTHCSTCREANVIMRPFARNTIALTSVQAAANSTIFLTSLKFKAQHRKTWWVPIAVGIAAHSFAAAHNSQYPRTSTINELKARLDALEKARQ